MARTPKLRIHFESDVAYLLRLKQAIEDDDQWPVEWKESICIDLQKLALRLMAKPEKLAAPVVDDSGNGKVA